MEDLGTKVVLEGKVGSEAKEDSAGKADMEIKVVMGLETINSEVN
jgi:hypothetical protein